MPRTSLAFLKEQIELNEQLLVEFKLVAGREKTLREKVGRAGRLLAVPSKGDSFAKSRCAIRLNLSPTR
jgi:hypothetical protein